MSTMRVIAVVGPTAGGKTQVGERVASAVGGEIVCADSRQVFRELDVGTGKPSSEERASGPHHLFDSLTLGERASAGWYARAAKDACQAVWERGRIPVLVGGSGLYLRAARGGLAATPPHDPAVRDRLMAELEKHGPEALHTRLRTSDPETAARLQVRDRQRIVRALEVLEATQRPLSWWHRQDHAAAVGGTWHIFELQRDPDHTRQQIALRTTWMLSNGLVEETESLLSSRHAEALRRLRAIGYDEVLHWLEGSISREEAEIRTNHRTAQLAKRQRTWFRHQLDACVIPDMDSTVAAQRIVAHFQAGEGVA